jgi:hypothetical protein
MTPTPEYEQALRVLIDEVIPVGGTDADTRFTDGEIDVYLMTSDSLPEAAANAWMAKAAKVVSKSAGILALSVGSERVQFSTPKDLADFAIKMAQYYRGLIPGFGSTAYAIDYPVVARVIVRDDLITEQQYKDALVANGIPWPLLDSGNPGPGPGIPG